MAQSFYVTDVTIGREGNVITYANDGSMVFSDRFVPGVRLVDLLNGSGSEGGGAASITKEVLTTDWGLDHHDPIYNRPNQGTRHGTFNHYNLTPCYGNHRI
jgi:hypothetical protein